MTREEILALPAGSALDALVAEKVMGWRVTIGETSHKGRVIAWPDPEQDGFCFEPSTDIAAAWRVLEKVKTWLFSRRQQFLREVRCVVSRREQVSEGLVIGGLDLLFFLKPEDVCRAALLATLE